MGRIFQIICGGVLALTLVGAAPSPSERAQAEQTEATQDLAKATEALARNITEQARPPRETPLLERPCEPGQDQRASDLCAQWKAADAASRAAASAASVGIASWIGVFLGLGTLIAAGFAAKYAKAAATHTEAGADVARNALTADTRAWINVDIASVTLSISIIEGVPHVRAVSMVRLENFGKTPAKDVSVRARFVAHPHGEIQIDSLGEPHDWVEMYFDSVFPTTPVEKPGLALQGPFGRGTFPYVMTAVRYQSIAGSSHETIQLWGIGRDKMYGVLSHLNPTDLHDGEGLQAVALCLRTIRMT